MVPVLKLNIPSALFLVQFPAAFSLLIYAPKLILKNNFCTILIYCDALRILEGSAVIAIGKTIGRSSSFSPATSCTHTTQRNITN